jgi:putative transposase
MELEWLKKSWPLSIPPRAAVNQQRSLIDSAHSRLSIRRQCQLLGMNRSSLYTAVPRRYEPAQTSDENLFLMQLIDADRRGPAVYTRHPFLGSRPPLAAVIHRVFTDVGS